MTNPKRMADLLTALISAQAPVDASGKLIRMGHHPRPEWDAARRGMMRHYLSAKLAYSEAQNLVWGEPVYRGMSYAQWFEQARKYTPTRPPEEIAELASFVMLKETSLAGGHKRLLEIRSRRDAIAAGIERRKEIARLSALILKDDRERLKQECRDEGKPVKGWWWRGKKEAASND